MLVFANVGCRGHITSGAVQIISVVAVVVGGCHWVAVVGRVCGYCFRLVVGVLLWCGWWLMAL